MANEDLIKRVPPHSAEAEQACIGAMLSNNEQAINTVFETLKSEDFFDPKHQVIFDTIKMLQEESAPVDLVSVADRMESMGQLSRAGGSAFLSSLSDRVPASSSVGYYARMVADKSLLRSLIQASHQIIDDVFQNQSKPEHISEMAERAIFDVTNRKLRTSYAELKDVVTETLTGIERLAKDGNIYTGLPTGFKKFDELTGGLQKGALVVLAARPAMGKTAMALNIASNVCTYSRDNGALVFSLEMSDQELAMRMLSSESRIAMEKIRKGRLSDQHGEWGALVETAGRLHAMNIIVDDTPAISIHEIRAKSRRVVSKYKVNLIIIDHMQLITADESSKPSFNRNAEISYISRSLKALAKELDLPIVVLSQLSRSVESRQDKRPMLSDLRESGAIEQDADIVTFLYRDEYYNKETEKKGISELIIAKQRNGPTDTIDLTFLGECVRFENLDAHHLPPLEIDVEDSGF